MQVMARPRTGNKPFLEPIWSQIARFMGPKWGPPGCCRSQMGPMLAPCTLLSGIRFMDAYMCHIVRIYIHRNNGSSFCLLYHPQNGAGLAVGPMLTARMHLLYENFGCPFEWHVWPDGVIQNGRKECIQDIFNIKLKHYVLSIKQS